MFYWYLNLIFCGWLLWNQCLNQYLVFKKWFLLCRINYLCRPFCFYINSSYSLPGVDLWVNFKAVFKFAGLKFSWNSPWDFQLFNVWTNLCNSCINSKLFFWFFVIYGLFQANLRQGGKCSSELFCLFIVTQRVKAKPQNWLNHWLCARRQENSELQCRCHQSCISANISA